MELNNSGLVDGPADSFSETSKNKEKDEHNTEEICSQQQQPSNKDNNSENQLIAMSENLPSSNTETLDVSIDSVVEISKNKEKDDHSAPEISCQNPLAEKDNNSQTMLENLPSENTICISQTQILNLKPQEVLNTFDDINQFQNENFDSVSLIEGEKVNVLNVEDVVLTKTSIEDESNNRSEENLSSDSNSNPDEELQKDSNFVNPTNLIELTKYKTKSSTVFINSDIKNSSLGFLQAQYNDSSEESSDDSDIQAVVEYREKEVEILTESSDDESNSDLEIVSVVHRNKTIDLEKMIDGDEDDDDDDVEGCQRKKRQHMRVKGEFMLEDLPQIEDLYITVPETECVELGKVHSIIDQLILVDSIPGTVPLNLDTVLFLEKGKKVLGEIFDVLGQVQNPLYCVRFNSNKQIKDKGIEIGQDVYVAPRTEHTHFIILPDLLKLRGSDASWKDDIEVSENQIDYSDDEQERRKDPKNKNGNETKRQRTASSRDQQAGQNRQQSNLKRTRKFENGNFNSTSSQQSNNYQKTYEGPQQQQENSFQSNYQQNYQVPQQQQENSFQPNYQSRSYQRPPPNNNNQRFRYDQNSSGSWHSNYNNNNNNQYYQNNNVGLNRRGAPRNTYNNSNNNNRNFNHHQQLNENNNNNQQASTSRSNYLPNPYARNFTMNSQQQLFPPPPLDGEQQ